MNPAQLLSDLHDQGVSMTVHNGKLKLKPKSNIKPEQVEQLREHKAEIIHLLQPQKNVPVCRLLISPKAAGM
jgi:hypothetical protein